MTPDLSAKRQLRIRLVANSRDLSRKSPVSHYFELPLWCPCSFCANLLLSVFFMAGPGMQQIQGLAMQQVLAPQLQQSLQILQAPTLELKNIVQQELQTNPVLEEGPEPSGDRGSFL